MKQPISPSKRALSSLKALAVRLRDIVVDVEPCPVGVGDARLRGRLSKVTPGVMGNLETGFGI